MKRLSLIALSGAFLLGLAALPGSTAQAGTRHHCCQGFAACNAATITQPSGPGDQYKFQRMSLCYKCWYPYADVD
jgi:hypothetical protein